MGAYRKDKEITNSPISGTITWNAKTGNWFYIDHPEEGVPARKMVINSFSAIILEPDTYCVTGKKYNSTVRHISNTCKRDDYDLLHVRTKTPVGNSDHTELIASGKWKDIKSIVKGSGGQWTLSLIVWVIAMKGKDQDANGNVVGDLKTVDWEGEGQIVQVRMRGGAIIHGFGKFETESGIKKSNMDGLAISVSGRFEHTGDSGTYFYPTMKSIGYVTQVEKVQKYASGCAALYEIVQEYLKEHFESVDEKYSAGMVDKPANQRPLPDPAKKPSAPVEFDTATPDSEADDDLPF